MAIKITATSTCDLPPELLERHQITIVPLYISRLHFPGYFDTML